MTEVQTVRVGKRKHLARTGHPFRTLCGLYVEGKADGDPSCAYCLNRHVFALEQALKGKA